jgi:hypothetical protein
MRTQKSTRSLRSATITQFRSPYVCPSCRRNASRIRSQVGTAARPFIALRQPNFPQIASSTNTLSQAIHNSSLRTIETPSANPNHDTDPNISFPSRSRRRRTGRRAVEGGPRIAIEEEAPSPLDNHGDFATREGVRARLKKLSEEQARLAIASGAATPQPLPPLPPPNSLTLEVLEPVDEFDSWDRIEDNVGEGGEEENQYARNLFAIEPGDVFGAKM